MPKQSINNARMYLVDGSATAEVISNITNFVCDTVDASGHFVNSESVSQTLNGLGEDAPYVQVGSIFTIGATQYVITAINNDGSGADDVEFTGTLATGTSVVTTIKAQANNRQLEIKVGEGDLTFSIKKERIYDLDRGKLSTVRNGDEQPMELSCTFEWAWLRSDSTKDVIPTVYEVLQREGLAWMFMSSAADPCEPYALDFQVDITAECSGSGIKGERLSFLDFREETIDPNLKEGSVAFGGKCNTTKPLLERLATFN